MRLDRAGVAASARLAAPRGRGEHLPAARRRAVRHPRAAVYGGTTRSPTRKPKPRRTLSTDVVPRNCWAPTGRNSNHCSARTRPRTTRKPAPRAAAGPGNGRVPRADQPAPGRADRRPGRHRQDLHRRAHRRRMEASRPRARCTGSPPPPPAATFSLDAGIRRVLQHRRVPRPPARPAGGPRPGQPRRDALLSWTRPR